MKIPYDIKNPVVPNDYYLCQLSGVINKGKAIGVEVPDALKKFTEEYPEEAAKEWKNRFLDEIHTQSIELIERWYLAFKANCEEKTEIFWCLKTKYEEEKNEK